MNSLDDAPKHMIATIIMTDKMQRIAGRYTDIIGGSYKIFAITMRSSEIGHMNSAQPNQTPAMVSA